MSLTPDYCRKVGLGVAPSPTPFLTPRPDRKRADYSYSSSRSTIDWNPSRHDKDREANVQVLLRCRPLSDEEQRLNIPKAITCNEHKREVTVSQNVANKQVDRVFTFDKVFGPKAQQRSIYDQAISPVVNDVLEGFNCTVFAYGQTGTGKTYTMEGGMKNKSGELPAEAGVIPRAVRQIFDTLEAQNADYSMKVTFLELYNEEITDLLTPPTEEWSRPPLPMEERQKKPVSLMEDGKGCVILRGLEEEAVYSANEIYNLLERGAARRRTADTLLNKRSSRSHSVFTITVHIKEATVGNEELIKCGKLNLVDLAGSENISRSGSREGRAREAGEINKSLLTLGRVINALVEHSVHVPYRDSKLTRLLRDSLGGKTKTCIIATISSSAQCLEETLSTLDYAHRAKNIKNKPEANQKISKAVLLKDLYLEIERMKQDVRAAREKNGIYIPHERFLLDEAEKKAKNEKIEQLEIDLNISEKQVSKFRELYVTEQEEKLNFERELSVCQINLGNCHKTLQDLEEKQRLAISELKEKEFIISKLLHSEICLVERAKELRANLQNASEDISALFSEIDHKNRLEAQNQGVLMAFGSQLDQSLKDMHKTILGSVSQQHEQLRCMEEHASSFLARKCDLTQVLESRIQKMTETYRLGVTTLKDLADTLQMKACSDMEEMKSKVSSQVTAVENFLATAILEGKGVESNIQESLNEQRQLLIFSTQQQEEGLQRALVSAQVISKATVDFFHDLSQHASKLMIVVRENQINNSNQLATFEKMFKEEAAREEKVAMEKIAEILTTLTANRTAMVSEASRNIEETNLRESELLRQEMFKVHQVSAVAKQGLNAYAEQVKSHFVEDAFTSAQVKAAMENCLQECTNTAACSMLKWDNAHSFINHINKKMMVDTESMLKAKVCENHAAQKEFISTCLSVDADFEVEACDVQSAVNDSLKLDRETKKELDFISSLCLDQLKSIREKHSGSILNIRNQTEHCLTKDYVVDHHHNSGMIRSSRVIEVPSLASIEKMKTQDLEDLISENRQNCFIYSNSNSNESKTMQQQQELCGGGGASPNRTPFANVN